MSDTVNRLIAPPSYLSLITYHYPDKGVGMKSILLSILCVLTVGMLFSQVADFTGLPDLASALYDPYSYNYTNALMTARGNTGIARPDMIGSGIYNPAAYRSDHTHFAFEVLAKFTSPEYNTNLYNDDMTPLGKPYRLGNNYGSPSPLSYLGIGLSPQIWDINIGFSYHLNKSIQYDTFKRIGFGNNHAWSPRYSEHQYTLTANKPFGPLTVGANAILLYPFFEAYRAEGTAAKYNFSAFGFSSKVGLLYELEMIQFGLTYTPQTTINMGNEYIPIKLVHPTTISAGTSLNITKDIAMLLDVDYTRYSETAPELSDLIVYKLGIEKHNPKIVWKTGLIYRPSVFDGFYIMPTYPDGNEIIPDPYYDFHVNNLPTTGEFRKADMLLFTLGASVNLLRSTKLHLAFLTNVAGDIDRYQLNTSLEFNVSALKRRKK